MEKKPILRRFFKISDKKYVRCCKNLYDGKLIGSEDGMVSIIKEGNYTEQMELEENELFLEEVEEEKNDIKVIKKKLFFKIFVLLKKKKKNNKQTLFDPLKK